MTKQTHLDDALASLTIKLTPDEISRLEESYIPHGIQGFE
jgi:hypothetical protein